MDNKQLFICDFIEKSCKEERHDECNEEWEGPEGLEPIIRVRCNCSCHNQIENRKPDSVNIEKQSQTDIHAGRQTNLDKFGDNNV